MPEGATRSAVDVFIARLGDPGVVREIHPADGMYNFHLESLRGSHDAARMMYFEKGRQIADAFSAAVRWRFGKRGAASALDFASGYGRATRFLCRGGDVEELWVSEIDPEAVRFQERAFGVHGFPSSSVPSKLSAGRTFEAVFAASFFSHVPRGSFGPWLRALYGLVEPGGLLAFSVHGPALHPGPADWSDGIVFHPESETRRLDPAAYGTSWVAPEFVARKSREVAGEEARLAAIPYGLCGHQDLYLLAKPPDPPTVVPAIPLFPRGELDASGIEDGTLSVEGWARAPAEQPSPDVSFAAGGSILRRSFGGGAPPARRWTFRIPIAGISADEVIRIDARTALGHSSTVAMGTLRPYLPRPLLI